ncbi:MAG: Gfo/Idh/MocA family oxidoreductase [Candidatus Methylacidiphilales bacterium]|nr:Gfo/Idh/MocA family oxidoreductase [Candidatus Methylacidiphilales bacterium]
MPLNTVIVGCGHIAKAYASNLLTYPGIKLTGFFDLDLPRADAFANEFGGRSYPTLDAVLADTAVDLVVNLTIHHAHEEVVARCLGAGKHVHTEKPLALSAAAAQRLAAQADKHGLRLSSAPSTWLGEAQQSAAAVLASGALGRIRQVFAEINHGRIESWHPNPSCFYEVGVLWDVCIYPLTLLTAFFGPVRSVQSFQRTLLPERRTQNGTPFVLQKPEFIVAMLDFENGCAARLSGNFYNLGTQQGSAVEFHGDAGSLILGSSFLFNARVESCQAGQPLTAVERPDPGVDGIEFGRGVRELARAIEAGVPHPCSAHQAAHVIEIMEAIDASASDQGRPYPVHSAFPHPRFSWPS